MRRLFTAARTVLFLALAAGLWGWFFRASLSPSPQFVVRTGSVPASDVGFRSIGVTWVTLRNVSDDGRQVTIGIHTDTGSGVSRVTSRLEVWDLPTGTNQTPALWSDPELVRLTSRNTGMLELLSRPEGKGFTPDEATWSTLLGRLTTGRAKALDDIRKTLRPVYDNEAKNLFPESAYFGPDGRHFAYVVRNGWPLYGYVSESLGDGTAIKDVRTGERVGFLPGVTDSIRIGPGGRTAVSRNQPPSREGEQPRLILWDLEKSARRAELLLPAGHTTSPPRYSPDGRYLFAWYWPATGTSPFTLRWWDAPTGQQLGDIGDAGDMTLTENGRVLVTHPHRTRNNAVAESYLLRLWDVATGTKLGEWNLDSPPDGGGLIHSLTAAEHGHYLAAVYDPDYGRGAPTNWSGGGTIIGIRFQPTSADRRLQVILLDTRERRELGRVPGCSAALSRDGRFLATIDEAGDVRVWELPLRKPWAALVGYTTVATLLSWAAAAGLRRLGRRPAVGCRSGFRRSGCA